MMQLFNGDCLHELDNIPDDCIDMVLMDPPYSSGALHAGGRKASTRSKYCSTEFNGSARFQSFTGDNMDQRCLIYFLREVFMGLRPKVKEGGDPGRLHRLEKLAGYDRRASDGGLHLARHCSLG